MGAEEGQFVGVIRSDEELGLANLRFTFFSIYKKNAFSIVVFFSQMASGLHN